MVVSYGYVNTKIHVMGRGATILIYLFLFLVAKLYETHGFRSLGLSGMKSYVLQF